MTTRGASMETNLARLADEALERFGDYPSLFFGGVWHSTAAMHDRAARVASGLRADGIAAGERVVVIMANCPEVTITYQALWRAGAVITPVVFLVTAPELRHIIEDSGAVAVVTTPEIEPKVAAALEGRPLPVYVVGGNFAEL
ncbi:MAG TPA: AMP-binding protein, partial [Micromonosporaceae bacterium]